MIPPSLDAVDVCNDLTLKSDIAVTKTWAEKQLPAVCDNIDTPDVMELIMA